MRDAIIFGVPASDPIVVMVACIIVLAVYFGLLRLSYDLIQKCIQRKKSPNINSQRKKNMLLMTDYGKKRYMVESFNQIIKDTSGYNPGYYVAGGEGNPRIYDKHEHPRKSIKENTPIEVLTVLANIMKEDYC